MLNDNAFTSVHNQNKFRINKVLNKQEYIVQYLQEKKDRGFAQENIKLSQFVHNQNKIFKTENV